MFKKVLKIIIVLVIGIAIIQHQSTKTQAATPVLQQDKLVSIALKEKGSRYKKKYGPRPWCTAFVSWAARSAKISTKVIPNTASSTTMYKQLLKSGGKVVKTPQKGDLVFYKRSSKSSTMMHAAIMTSSTMSIHGNYSKKVSYLKATDYRVGKTRVSKSRIVYVRPNYPKAPSKPTLTSASMNETKVELTWKKVSNTTSYTIYMKNSANQTVYTKSVSASTTRYSFTYNNQKYGTYSLYIKANNSVGSSALSSAKKVVYKEPEPIEPIVQDDEII